MIDATHEHHPEHSIRSLCRLFGVSRAWYYARPKLQQRRLTHQALVCEPIETIVRLYPAYGYRRVSAALWRAGGWSSPKQVYRLMRLHGWRSHLPHRCPHTTQSPAREPLFPNLTKGVKLHACNTCWVADITAVRLPEHWIYLACVLDAYSRKCIGYHLSDHLDASLPLNALEMAIATRGGHHPGLIHHSDQGVQYTSHAYLARLDSIGARPSLSARGKPTENAKAESFFKTLKYEEVFVHQYQNWEDATSHIETFLYEVYNAKRLHSSLGYLPPDEFEQLHL